LELRRWKHGNRENSEPHLHQSRTYNVTLTVTDDRGETGTTTQTVTVVFTLSLKAGWNMISLPVTPGDNTVSTILSGVGYYQVVTWNPSQGCYVTATSFESGKGYWVFVTHDVDVKVAGTL
jgi:hypothetical protein